MHNPLSISDFMFLYCIPIVDSSIFFISSETDQLIFVLLELYEIKFLKVFQFLLNVGFLILSLLPHGPLNMNNSLVSVSKCPDFSVVL